MWWTRCLVGTFILRLLDGVRTRIVFRERWFRQTVSNTSLVLFTWVSQVSMGVVLCPMGRPRDRNIIKIKKFKLLSGWKHSKCVFTSPHVFSCKVNITSTVLIIGEVPMVTHVCLTTLQDWDEYLWCLWVGTLTKISSVLGVIWRLVHFNYNR